MAIYLLNRNDQSRLVRAFSGTALPDDKEESDGRLKRRPSWNTKFEGPEVPPELEKALNEGAEKRLVRRPS